MKGNTTMTIAAQTEVRTASAPPENRRAPARAHSPDTPPDCAVSGLLDIGGSNSAFIRTAGFQPGPDDVFVPAALIKQYGLRRGDQIDGAARVPGTSGPAHNGNGQAPSRD